MIYANENDPNAAHWLTKIPIQIDHVDSRSITEVQADDLNNYTQCHFFAGIGGWPLALQLAGYPADAQVWTGSCPCQPFSQAGKRKGTADERHLWPEFLRLITECQPATIFGEQVASKAGRDWLAVVRNDLETLGYAVGAADLSAASVGAPHIRQRLFWVAHSDSRRLKEHLQRDGRTQRCKQQTPCGSNSCGCCEDGRVADSSGSRLEEGQEQSTRKEFATVERSCDARWLANSQSDRREQRIANYSGSDSRIRTQGEFGRPTWDGSNIEFVLCRDGKARPVKPGVRLLAYGVSGRVAQLRGLGNAIVPQVAAEFIGAFMDASNMRT